MSWGSVRYCLPMPSPVPPVNVKIHNSRTGAVLAVDCTYSGFDRGMHQWVVVTNGVLGDAEFDAITAERIPPATCISLTAGSWSTRISGGTNGWTAEV